MRKIVIFDFDGTITSADTLPRFIRFAFGTFRYIIGLITCAPVLIAYKLNLMSNSKAKQHLFSHYFKGMPITEFESLGCRFIPEIDKIVRPHILDTISECTRNNSDIYVISASMKQWISPWCNLNGVKTILSTEPEIICGKLTGQFLTPNCYGLEKRKRFEAVEPARNSYFLTVYGDSHGDDALFDYADIAFRVSNNGLKRVK